MNLLLCLLVAATPIEQAEADAALSPANNVIYTRYLRLDNIDEEKREHHLAIVSFVLNSISNKKKITLPTFVNKEKTLIKFDIRDYGIAAKAYDSLKKDFYTPKSKILNTLTHCENSIMRSDWFIINAMKSPTYYKLLGVSNLKDFRKRNGDDGRTKKLKIEQIGIVISSGLARNTRLMKRLPLLNGGAMWESRTSKSVDYLLDIFSEKYDSIQLLASNNNGLISYFASDDKGNAQDHLDPDVAIDFSRAFEPDVTVHVAKSCVVCHNVGVLPVEDEVRGIVKKNINIQPLNRDDVDKFNELFGSELRIKKDQDIYKEALLKTTGMDTKTFTNKFISIWKIYYRDLTLEQVAKEIGIATKEFRMQCQASNNFHLVRLFATDKISRVNFEKIMESK